MTKEEQRASLIAEAMSWLRTPYHHMGRVKGLTGGVDCAMFITEVFERAGLVPHVEVEHYPRDWHLHRTDERFIGYISRWADRVDVPLPADIVTYHIGLCFAHAAIVLPPGWPHIVHSDMDARCVTLADGSQGRHAIQKSGEPRKRTFWRLRAWV